jgi:hypothetical protein
MVLWAAGLFFSIVGMAHPFFPQTGLALGDMDRDGDLIMRLPITGLKTQDGDTVEVTLEHRQETGDFGEVKSRFILRPFETGIWERQEGEVGWQPPYGFEIVFSAKWHETLATDHFPLPSIGKSDVAWTSMKTADGIRLWWNASELAVLEQAKWLMVYRNGGLAEIRSPKGTGMMITSSGRRVTEWRDGNKILGQIEWEESSPRILHTPNGDYVFRLDENGRVLAVLDARLDVDVLRIHYAKTGMVSRVWTLGAGEVTIDWRANEGYGCGDSFYRKPYSVARMGNVKYRYHRDGNIVRMDMTAGDGTKRILRWKMLNGRIISVTGK